MKLVKISSDKIQIKTNDDEFKNVKINDLMCVSDNDTALITSVSLLTDTDCDTADEETMFDSYVSSLKIIECDIIGSLDNGNFVKAIDKYPTTNVDVKLLTDDNFKAMIKRYEQGFKLGKYANYSCDAFINGNKFFQKHACIVGNTGSGKSETVANILEKASKLKSANMIVFDIHGEYSGLSYARTIKIGEETPFPLWLLGFSDIVTNILKIKEETSTGIMTALRECYYAIRPNGNDKKPIHLDFGFFVQLLDELNTQEVATGEFYKTGDKAGTPKTTKGEYNGKLTGVINQLNDKLNDYRYKFMFTNEKQGFLFDFVNDILSNDKPVKNIDLSSVPHDMVIPIISAITKIVYDLQLLKDDYTPVTFVCDEAHVYIPSNFNLSASERRSVEIFEQIAKEGRKFGITLFVASQRPSELNRTIMAQCGNFIVGKLNNENDKTMMKGLLPEGADKLIEMVAMFEPGNVLVIGDSVPIPLKIKVDLASERPQSRTVDFWDKWNEEKTVDIKQLYDRYLKA